ncbi:MAG: HAMP domain-containing protein [Ignavibacteriae bacterium]|nr:HAMP domain-containing protein [Ignavibacteriota bacterium]NOG99200.1 HAMP domain-containing protein [Ignavibacteriota bacterium]
MKIRYRLTLWYYAVTFTILIIFNIGLFYGVQHLLYMAFDKELNIVVDTIERSYSPADNNFNELNKIAESINLFTDYYLIIHNKLDEPIYSSSLAENINLEIDTPESPIEKRYTRHLKAAITNDSLMAKDDNEITFRVISRQLFYNNQVIGRATIGLPITKIEESLKKFLFVLLIALLGGLILIGIGGYYLTLKSLRPVDIITQRAKQISRSSLTERIKVENEHDELGQLSKVLNDLLTRLQNAFMSQQQFLTDAAHELKTPLSILRLHWENEINNTDLSIELKEKLVQDIETISRLNHLINNLLLLSKTEDVNTIFKFEELNLKNILQEVIADAEVLAELKEQKITIVDIVPVIIKGDKLRLYQLFFNLIDNAIKYSPVKESIFISLNIKENKAVVEIKDNGSGIPAEDIDNIFTRFYRVHKDRARKSGGSGLGLSIVKLIAESHGGYIEVSSILNKGSTFKVILPRYKN